MKAVQKQFGLLMLLVSCASAQDRITAVQDVTATREGNGVRVEVTLSEKAGASVKAVGHPDRIVLELASARCETKVGKVTINVNGVRTLVTTQYSGHPPVVRVVVDLDQPHEYSMKEEGTRIILDILATTKLRSGSSQGAPATASSGSVTGIFQRHRSAQASDNTDQPEKVGIPPSTPGIQTSPVVSSSVSIASSTDTSVGRQVASVSQSSAANVQPASSAIQDIQPPQHAHDDSNRTSTSGPVETPASTASENTETTLTAHAADPGLRTVFKIKYVAEGVAYLDGGRSAGLTEGMKLEIQDSGLPPRDGVAVNPTDSGVVAELVVTAVAETSAVTDIHTPKRSIKPGDLAYLSTGDSEALVQQRALSATRKYPAVITFTDGDPLDEEVHDELPRPPLPSVNRARGRIGLDYMGTISHGTSAMTNSDVGMIFRGDITRINGTYWNLSGYWRGRFTSQVPAGQQTVQDLINRTYHLSMTYDNPNSSLVAGFGRLYLPWAPSLNTIDGGYFGKRLSKGSTLGIFGGSTPDPTSWNYSTGRVIGGAFVNFDGGSFDGLHYSSTSGAGISMVNWQSNRPFVFFENTLSYKRYLSIYDSLQADSPSGNPAVPAPGPGLSVNFLTIRVQPHPRLELDFNYNYFRDVPTFDPTLIGTGLLDKYLFQGFSMGGRVEVRKQIFIYTDLGRSNRTGDATTSLNQMYGVTFGRVPWIGVRADAHYSRFNSSFGDGSYRAFSISRSFLDNLRLEVLAGDQKFASSFTSTNHSRFITGNVETNLGPHYFLQGGYTVNRGQMSYDQWMFTIGYRFDSKERHRE